MALPSMRFPMSPSKADPAPVQGEPADDQKKAALRRRGLPKKPNPEEDLVNGRKQAGY